MVRGSAGDELPEGFARVRQERLLRSGRELPGNSFRELGGVFMHIGREGEPLFGLGGCHRLAIGRILGLPIVPAQVGVVHSAALTFWRKRFHAGRRTRPR